MKLKYEGCLAGLQKRVLDCNVFGEWQWLEPGQFYQFRSLDGEIMNWWPSTKTISFQGQPGRLQPRYMAVFVH